MTNNRNFQIQDRIDRFDYAKRKAESLLSEGFRFLVYQPRPQSYPNHHFFKPTRVFDRQLKRRQIPIDSPKGLEILAWYVADGDGYHGAYDILEEMRMEEYEMYEQMKAEEEKAKILNN